MQTKTTECTASTYPSGEFIDITLDVEAALSGSGVRDGQVTVFSPRSTCPLVVNELETGLLKDILDAVGRAAGAGADRPVGLVGSSSVVLPAVDGRLRLGTWQRILLVELDGGGGDGAERSFTVQIVGE